MKSLVVVLYILTVTECTQSHSRSVHKVPTHKSTAASALVDAQWIEVYRRMEHDHGDYKIPDDNKIMQVGSKFRVSKSVLNHFQDLMKAGETERY